MDKDRAKKKRFKAPSLLHNDVTSDYPSTVYDTNLASFAFSVLANAATSARSRDSASATAGCRGKGRRGARFVSNCSLFTSVWTCFSLACSQATQVKKIAPWHHSRHSLSRPIWMIQRITHRRSAIGLWLRWLVGFSPHDVMKERWQKATWRKVHSKSSIPWYTRKSLQNMLYDYSTELWLKQENVLHLSQTRKLFCTWVSSYTVVLLSPASLKELLSPGRNFWCVHGVWLSWLWWWKAT